MDTRRARIALLMVVLVAAVVGYLGAGAYVWASTTQVNDDCMALHRDQTPATFVATWGSEQQHNLVVVDAAPYRFEDAAEVSLPSLTPGITLDAWWAPSTDPAAGAVIVVHGRNS